jgi:hypothetical protein
MLSSDLQAALEPTGTLAAVILAVAGVLALLGRLARRVRTTLRRLREFLDDWQGVPARPGVAGRAGVLAQIGELRDGLTCATERLDKIEASTSTVKAQLTNNGGASVKDAIDRIERQVTPDS